MKKIFFIIFILFMFILSNYKQIETLINPVKGLFEDIILDEFQEENFDKLSITKRSNNKLENTHYEDRNSKDKIIVNKLLNYFKGLELREVHIEKKYFKYDVTFRNSKTFEDIWIWILDEKYIEINARLMVAEINEEKNITKWKSVSHRTYYEVENGKIDLEFIDEMFNQLEKWPY